MPMDLIPGRNEALCRVYTMRSLRDEGASIAVIARFFGHQPHDVEMLIEWHMRLYPVMPARDEVGMPNLLDHFRLDKPP